MIVRRLLIALIAAATPLAASAPQTRAPFICDVFALDADGQPATNLTAADFQVRIDDAPAPVVQCARAPRNLSLVVLVDGTASQPLKRYEILDGVLTGLIPNLQPDDRARLALLGNPTKFSAWLPAEIPTAASMARTFLDRPPIEPSPIWDAVDAATKAFGDAPAPHALIVISDGRATGNAIGLEEAARRAVAASMPVNVVSEGGEWLIPQFGDAPDRARSDASLRWLADATGGLFLEDGTARRTLKPQMNAFAYVRELLNTPSKPAPLVQAMLAGLRARYRLTIDAPADGRPHTLNVSTTRTGVSVRGAKSYVAR